MLVRSHANILKVIGYMVSARRKANLVSMWGGGGGGGGGRSGHAQRGCICLSITWNLQHYSIAGVHGTKQDLDTSKVYRGPAEMMQQAKVLSTKSNALRPVPRIYSRRRDS